MAPPATLAGPSPAVPASVSFSGAISPSATASSSRLSPARASLTTPTRGPLSRSSSSRSDLSVPGDMRHWTPTRAIALTGIEGKEGRGKVTAKEDMGDAERGLSSLYVENERIVGTRESRTSPSKKGRRTWGGSLVSGAMNAGVFGAALGLTAYRIWNGEERESSASTTSAASTLSRRGTLSDTPCSSASTSAGPSSLRSRPDSVELPPPPTYSESSHHALVSTVSTVKEDEEWEDLDIASILPGLHSRTPSKTSPPRQHRHRSRMSRSRIIKIPARSVASITVEDVLSPSSEQPPPMSRRLLTTDHLRDASFTVAGQEGRSDPKENEEGDDQCQEGVDSGEVLRRLDAMGDTLQAMILEAKKALALPSPVVVGTEGWEDEAPVSGKKAKRRPMES